MKTVIYIFECFRTEVSETEVSESEVSYSKVSGTEVSKINPRFMYALSMLYLGGSTTDVGEVSEIKCLSVFKLARSRTSHCRN